jgi:hypothetical protein
MKGRQAVLAAVVVGTLSIPASGAWGNGHIELLSQSPLGAFV